MYFRFVLKIRCFLFVMKGWFFLFFSKSLLGRLCIVIIFVIVCCVVLWLNGIILMGRVNCLRLCMILLVLVMIIICVDVVVMIFLCNKVLLLFLIKVRFVFSLFVLLIVRFNFGRFFNVVSGIFRLDVNFVVCFDVGMLMILRFLVICFVSVFMKNLVVDFVLIFKCMLVVMFLMVCLVVCCLYRLFIFVFQVDQCKEVVGFNCFDDKVGCVYYVW